MTITYKKNNLLKIIDKESKLIPILELEGWETEKKETPKKKVKNNDNGK